MSRPQQPSGSLSAGGNECLQAALDYHRWGFCVIAIPLGSKKANRWKKYQTERPTETEIQRWFGGRSNKQPALVMGPVSGGLVCRDFDDLAAYQRWAAKYPDLAKTLPTVETGGGGRHVYARAKPEQIGKYGKAYLKFDDGELRLKDCYCVAPPSKHPDGGNYRWLVPMSELRLIDIAESGFVTDYSGATESDRERGDTGALQSPQSQPKITETTEAINDVVCSVGQSPTTPNNGSVNSVALCCTDDFEKLPSDIRKAIEESLPKKPGKRNEKVFEFARYLKAVPSLTDAKAGELKIYVQHWHRLALPKIGTKPFEETWIDFIRAWDRVKFPKGEEPIRQIFEQAKTSEFPNAAMHFENPRGKLLVSLCRELQRVAGDGVFFLSCRTAGRLLGVDHSTAGRWLFLLIAEGVLVEVEKGSQKKRRATRFRYVAD